MAWNTLADVFADLASAPGEFLVYDDGLRTRRYTYGDVARAATRFAIRLGEAGVHQGERVLFWSENRPEWVAAFWGCVLAGVVVVPIDYRASAEFAARVASIVGARLVLVGDDVTAASERILHVTSGRSAPTPIEQWPFADFSWPVGPEGQPPGRGGAPLHLEGPSPRVGRDDVAEIMFTSGATAVPKGVIITHRNILANIVPIEREVARYRGWGRPFFPLRFLDLLPLSHMFGQAMATFIPPMLPGTTVFMRGYNPAEIVAQVRRRRVSVVVCVPKILDVLREYAEHTWPETAVASSAGRPALQRPGRPARRGSVLVAIASVGRRWWRHRAVHRAFGFKFWSFVVGAAPLDPNTEAFWSSLGFVVIQGYGLTETAPIVSLNHPFGARKGSVGRAIPGVEVRIAPDGEILVRGENVSRGYFGDETGAGSAVADGWLHTGDIGELDAAGQLYVKGRKKEMIVTPEGLNVFPEDVERVIDEQPGVVESAVVGVTGGGEERVHAVVVLEPGADPERIIRDANARLADHQRIRGISPWTRGELPRTEGTRKLKRREIRQVIEDGAGAATPAVGDRSIEGVLARYTGGRVLRPDTTIEELGLTSLDRVELMVALDERSQAGVDEARFAEARTVADLRALVSSTPSSSAPASSPDVAWEMPAWSRGRIVAALRAASQTLWLLPLARTVARLEVRGLEHLSAITGPVVFAANHQSHLDTPVILAAMPARLRKRVAVAMSKEYFAAHFHPEAHARTERIASTLLYALASLFFNAFPIPQREAGARRALRYIGDLLSEGWSVLIFPEGTRSNAEDPGPFQPGIGMIGARLSVPVVPVRLRGVNHVLPAEARVPRPGRVSVAFGPAMVLDGSEYSALARQVEEAVRGI